MIDNFSLGLSHGLILIAMWRLFLRPDLDDDDAPPARGWLQPKRDFKPPREDTDRA